MGNRVMSESQAICEYIEELSPEPPLMPKGAEGRYEVRRAPSQITPENYGFAQVVPNTLVPGAPGAAVTSRWCSAR